MIIGVVGFIGSGKDTIADYLVNVHEFRRESFASTLKDAVASVFGWDRTMLEGRTKHSREWRDQVDEWWSKKLHKAITPRWVLQQWGTEVCRRGFHDDIWIASLENKLRHCQDDVVISDCRFPNEIQAIRSQGGMVLRVTRGPEPHWYHDAACVNQPHQHNTQQTQARARLADLDIHASETAWVGTQFDCTLDNNGTLDQLYDQINDLLRDLRAAKANLLE